MNRKLIQIAFLLLLLTACRQQSEKEPDHKIAVKTDSLAESMEKWIDYYKDFGIKTDSFRLVQTDTFPEFVRELNDFGALEKEKKELLKYSPDSSLVLDVFSYNLILEEDESGKMVYGKDADTEVLLLDPVRRISKRLLFVGPSVKVEDGYWLNNHEILLVGQYHEYEESAYQPVYWKINLKNNTIRYFEYCSIIQGLVPDYVEKIRFSKLR